MCGCPGAWGCCQMHLLLIGENSRWRFMAYKCKRKHGSTDKQSKRAIWNSGHFILFFVCFQPLLFSCTNKKCYLCDKCCQVRCLHNIMQHIIKEHGMTDKCFWFCSGLQCVDINKEALNLKQSHQSSHTQVRSKASLVPFRVRTSSHYRCLWT